MAKKKRKITSSDLLAENVRRQRNFLRDHLPVSRHVLHLPRQVSVERNREGEKVRLVLGLQPSDDAQEAR